MVIVIHVNVSAKCTVYTNIDNEFYLKVIISSELILFTCWFWGSTKCTTKLVPLKSDRQVYIYRLMNDDLFIDWIICDLNKLIDGLKYGLHCPINLVQISYNFIFQYNDLESCASKDIIQFRVAMLKQLPTFNANPYSASTHTTYTIYTYWLNWYMQCLSLYMCYLWIISLSS